MPSWIESLKEYYSQNNLKYKIPKKDSQEYAIILKFHQERSSSFSSSTDSTKSKVAKPKVAKPKVEKPKVVKVKKTKKIEPDADEAETIKVYKKTLADYEKTKKKKKTVPLVEEDDWSEDEA